jgi:hypothetical protein
MRPFTQSQFKKVDYEIPNLHPDYKMETRSTEDHYGRTRIYKCYFVKGSAIPLSATFAVNNEEWYPLFKVTPSGYITDYESSTAVACGLVHSKHNWDGESAIVDALYYLSNPVPLHNRNGTLRKGVWAQLRRRMNVTQWTSSVFSKQMLFETVRAVRDLLLTEDNDTVVDYLQNVRAIDVFKCHLTNEIMGAYYKREYEFANGYKACNVMCTPSSYGFVREDKTNGGSIWLTPEEVYFQGRVYDRATLVMVPCPVCSTDVPEQSIMDGACLKCNESKYKIHSYSTKVPSLLKFKAKNVKPSTVYLGIELEYESTDRDLAKVKVGKALHGHAIMKSDGSIRNGFEIVTCPATLDIHLEEFKRFYANFPKELFQASNTGMHVHVSRKPLNVFTIGKMTEFLNRSDNKPFIAYIAGRIDNSYARITDRTVTFPFLNGTSGERYNALNLSNTDTIEFRIFSTPKNWEEFSSRLEFCQALTDYCQPAQVNTSLKHLTGYPSFINWLQHNRKAYPELSNHLKGFA